MQHHILPDSIYICQHHPPPARTQKIRFSTTRSCGHFRLLNLKIPEPNEEVDRNDGHHMMHVVNKSLILVTYDGDVFHLYVQVLVSVIFILLDCDSFMVSVFNAKSDLFIIGPMYCGFVASFFFGKGALIVFIKCILLQRDQSLVCTQVCIGVPPALSHCSVVHTLIEVCQASS